MKTTQSRDYYLDKAKRILGKGHLDAGEVYSILSDEAKMPRADKAKKFPAELLLEISKKLKDFKEFGSARRILARARVLSNKTDDPELHLKIFQQSALCTYKDADLPADKRLNEALDILKKEEHLNTTTNQETLGLAGAIYKRKWEYNNQKNNLEVALLYYRRGREVGIEHDLGYTAINEAYLLDLLAYIETEEAKEAHRDSSTAETRRVEAKKIRLEIVTKLAPMASRYMGEWWFHSTLGEAHFGLQQYEEAMGWLVKSRPADMTIPEWEYESTARQLASLARLQQGGTISEEEFEQTQAGRVLREFLQKDSEAVRSVFVGKVGLALSGGGFRASLFHIGVLARLAELDLLRRVEVLSCVSGGSIIGAHYYLEVRRLLESKPDEDITGQDYIEIVKKIETDFLDGVQRNVRTRVAAGLVTNLKMLLFPNYSRTLRVGELYESEIFSKVKDRPAVDEKKERWLNDLRVQPLIGPGNIKNDFNPKTDNWRRGAKAPILILNAATLNTGHTWHFTVTYMGEPPGSINSEIDGNYRLRRMYYQDAPTTPRNYRKIRLGHAVAASSCVPGLFEPLALADLYDDKHGNQDVDLKVRLVDGGVCDNQGIGGLLEQDCSILLVSDASGQMESLNDPSTTLLGVPLRSSGILQARVREAQYKEMKARQESGQLRGFMFAHLKEGLGVEPLNWRECPPHLRISDYDRPELHPSSETSYEVAKTIQHSLAAIRTDLDSFCDIEADALMASAYLMTRNNLNKPDCLGELRVAEIGKVDWRFLPIVDHMKADKPDGSKKDQLEKILGVGSSPSFKIWKLSPVLKTIRRTLVFALIALVVPVCLLWANRIIIPLPDFTPLSKRLTIGYLVLSLLAVLLVVLAIKYLGKRVFKVVRWPDTLNRIAIGLLMSVFGFIAAGIHLLFFDWLYLHWGSRKRFFK
jgi:predicted acylesterase/phospholipase RssA